MNRAVSLAALMLLLITVGCANGAASDDPTLRCGTVRGAPCSTHGTCCGATETLTCISNLCHLPGFGLPCTTSDDCFSPSLVCSRTASGSAPSTRTCVYATNLKTGDPCNDTSQCKATSSNSCQGWCTQPCAKSADCGSGNLCAPSGSNPASCIPSCDNDGDCLVYQNRSNGYSLKCQPFTTIEGTQANGCATM